jgi:hypothetical protein
MFLSTFFTSTGMDNRPTAYFFNYPHLIYFLINVGLFIFLWRLLKKMSIKNQDKMINVFLLFILLLKYAGDAIFIYEYYYVDPNYTSYTHSIWDVDTLISFQLCGIMNILLPIVIWFKLKSWKIFVYISSILGGLTVLIYPVTILFGDPFIVTLPMLRSGLVHFFLLFIPLFLINRGDIELKKSDWKPFLIGTLIVFAWATFGNFVIDIGDNNIYLEYNPFYGTDMPFVSLIPNGWHILFIFSMFAFGYTLIHWVLKFIQPKKKLRNS